MQAIKMAATAWTIFTLILTVFFTKSIAETNVDFVYHNYTELTKIMENYNEFYPDLTHLYSIGKTVEERELWVIAISGRDPKKHVLGVPEVKYIANMHGDEPIGKELLIHFIGQMLREYTENKEEVRKFLDNTRLHVLPSLNPDGWERAFVNSNGNCSTTGGKYSGRQNSNSYDLNRNFPDYFEENLVDEQPETTAIRNWLESVPFVLSANFHAGALVADYPFDNLPPDKKAENPVQYSQSPDDDVFRNISLTYSYSHEKMYNIEENECNGTVISTNGSGFEDGITNGAAWYSATGGMLDYNYVSAGCLEISLSVSCCLFPLEPEIEPLYNDNKNALLQYLKDVHKGIRGNVNDENSLPIKDAYVEVLGRESKFFRTSSDGEFWRILLPGEYQVQASKDCYKSSTKTVTVPNDGLYSTVEIDFILERRCLETTTASTSCLLIPSILLFLCVIIASI